MTGYDFSFPAELVAREPASPRWSARLLIHDRKTRRTEWDVFRNIGKYLPPRSVLVLNETKVLPARLVLRKATGGLNLQLVGLEFEVSMPAGILR